MNDGDRVLLRSVSEGNSKEQDETYLPPRKNIHPSERGKWTNIFYQTLLWLFIGLVVGLTVWGIRYS